MSSARDDSSFGLVSFGGVAGVVSINGVDIRASRRFFFFTCLVVNVWFLLCGSVEKKIYSSLFKVYGDVVVRFNVTINFYY